MRGKELNGMKRWVFDSKIKAKQPKNMKLNMTVCSQFTGKEDEQTIFFEYLVKIYQMNLSLTYQ